ncbi:hypothetical protein [Mucilaginibacter boryungensis]|uniref:Uncharacterized protein n=1 Tax=Mucilaginibacter boryungensis TaxID=768480 RepID=A0ABR9XJU3_9SPHI|nr:hypothetical protein [Mucilaginibacter boryungensis]MBE9667329.1 hypothetical protein [Mucilaginibacter boryungensis]
MNYSSRQIKQILLITCLLFCMGAAIAQTKPAKESHEYKSFSKIASRSNVTFTLPEGFKELPVSGDNIFNYGMTIPGEDFEIWLKVTPQTDNTSDSLYVEMGKAEAKLLAGDNHYYTHGMPERVLTDYNADAGRSYFIYLSDSPATKHYKFALLITLQKNSKGTIMALCMTNDKGPDFFKNINKARNCIRFKP